MMLALASIIVILVMVFFIIDHQIRIEKIPETGDIIMWYSIRTLNGAFNYERKSIILYKHGK